MGLKLKNNAIGFLGTNISASNTGIVLQAGNGVNFPVLGSGDYFYATITSTSGTFEIVKVTARADDTMTIVRGQEGTTANGFSAGSRFELRVTAKNITDLSFQPLDATLTALAGLATGADKLPYSTGTDTFAQADFTTFARTLLDDADATAARTTLSAQAQDATLTALAGLGLVDNKIIRGTGVDTAELIHFSDYINVLDYGATGDGTTDDTTAIQAAITAANATTHKRLYFPAGTYSFRQQLIVHSGATWFGDGLDKSVLALNIAAGNIVPIRTNTTSGTKNVFDQTGVALYDLHIKGFDAVLTSTVGQTHSPLMRLWKIDGLTIERCKFSAHRYIMLSLGGVKNFSITNCEFEDWGRTDDLASSGTLPANEGGAAIWIAANPIDDTPSTFGTMRGNYFHDAEWSCVYLLGQNLDFSFNRMENFKEGNFAASASIFATTLPADSESQNITYIGNFHKGVTERLIQASAFECGGINVIVANNYFEACDGAAFDFTDAAENCVGTGNVCINCATSAYSANYASIMCRLTNVTAKACNGITISNNVIRSADDGQNGIRLYRISGSDTFNNIRIVNNDLVGAAADSADNLTYDATQFGTNVVIKDNNGAADYVPASATWTPTVDATSGTITTVTTPTARYVRQGNVVFFTLTITVTNNGTGSGALRFTLPSTALYAGTAVGRNTTNGVAGSATWGASATQATYNAATGVYPVTSGQIIRISGSYLEA